MMNFRVTRPGVYGPNALGHDNASARQGYYVDEECALFAVDAVREQQDHIDPDEPLDVQVWDGSDRHGAFLCRIQ